MQESEDSNEQFARYIVCAGHQGPAPQRVLESCRVTLSVFKVLQILIIRRCDIIYMSFHWSPQGNCNSLIELSNFSGFSRKFQFSTWSKTRDILISLFRLSETAKHFNGFDLFLTDNSQIWVVICENPNFRKLKRKEDRVRKQVSRNSYSLENKLHQNSQAIF